MGRYAVGLILLQVINVIIYSMFVWEQLSTRKLYSLIRAAYVFQNQLFGNFLQNYH